MRRTIRRSEGLDAVGRRLGDPRRDGHAGAAALLRREERRLDARAPARHRRCGQRRAHRHAQHGDAGRCEVSDRVRIYFTGDCEGFDTLRGALAATEEVDVVGASVQVDAATTPLTGGHLDAVLHATRGSDFPGGRRRGDPRAHAGAGHPARSGAEAPRCSSPPSTPDVADVLLAAAADPELVFAIRKACHARAPAQTASHRRAGHYRVLAEGRNRQDLRRDQPRRDAREEGGSARCSSTSTCSSATRRSCSGSSPRRRSTTWSSPRASSTRRSSPATSPRTRAASTSCRRRSGPRTPSSSSRASSPAARGRTRVVRHDHRRHVAVLPRADARDARPHGRAPAPVRAGHPDDQERSARRCRRWSCSRSRRADHVDPEPREHERRPEAERGRGDAAGRRCTSSCRATAPCRWPSTAASRSRSPSPDRTSRKAISRLAKQIAPKTQAPTAAKRKGAGGLVDHLARS